MSCLCYICKQAQSTVCVHNKSPLSTKNLLYMSRYKCNNSLVSAQTTIIVAKHNSFPVLVWAKTVAEHNNSPVFISVYGCS